MTQLLAAKRDLKLPAALAKLERFDAVILDDRGYVQQSREEMEVRFTFLAERYEKQSVVITSNLVFSQWDQIFKDPTTATAVVDRIVHHCVLLEFPAKKHPRGRGAAAPGSRLSSPRPGPAAAVSSQTAGPFGHVPCAPPLKHDRRLLEPAPRVADRTLGQVMTWR